MSAHAIVLLVGFLAIVFLGAGAVLGAFHKAVDAAPLPFWAMILMSGGVFVAMMIFGVGYWLVRR